eukprot:1133551-Pleurochrysis_carterae.AAC.1
MRKVAGKKHKGVGAVEAMDRLLCAAKPDTEKCLFPCPWVYLFGDCRKGAAGGCMHCQRKERGVADCEVPAGVMERLRAASTPEMLQNGTPPLGAPAGAELHPRAEPGRGPPRRGGASGDEHGGDAARPCDAAEPEVPPPPPEPPLPALAETIGGRAW